MKKLLTILVFLFSFTLVGSQCTSKKDIKDSLVYSEYAYITDPLIKETFSIYMEENKELVQEIAELNNIHKETVAYIIYAKTLNDNGIPIISFKTYMKKVGFYRSAGILVDIGKWLNLEDGTLIPFFLAISISSALILFSMIAAFKVFRSIKRDRFNGNSNKRDSS
jgi:hypothetical protein